ncbi:MAG: hypothetical protein MK165_12945 [Pirellulaceae bacterium]|nr:hypothetical protein [Pirellulaceae bacterium]
MAMRVFAISFCVVLSLHSGCRSNSGMRAGIEMMNLEKIALEDQILDLKYEYEILSDKLDEVTQKNTRLQRQLGKSSVDDALGNSPDGFNPARGSSDDPFEEAPELGPLQIEEGETFDPNEEIPPPVDKEKTELMSVPLRSPDVNPTGPSLDAAQESKVTHLLIDSISADHPNFDHATSQKGLQINVEARNAADKSVPVSGEFAVVVLDPAKRGPAARVGRWDFDAATIENILTKSETSEEILLTLPWDQNPPQNQELHLFVRYTSLTGDKIKADREILFPLSDSHAKNWTPRSKTRSTGDSLPAGRIARSQNDRLLKTEEAAFQKPTWSSIR